MPSPRNVSLSGEQTLNAILDLLDEHKERLLAIVESEETTPEDKYQALMRLASLTGILNRAATEPDEPEGADVLRSEAHRWFFSGGSR